MVFHLVCQELFLPQVVRIEERAKPLIYKVFLPPPWERLTFWAQAVIIYLHLLIEVLEMDRERRAELARMLHGLAMGFAGGIFAMVVFVGISEWVRILGG